MKKILAILIAVLMVFSAVPLARAENPPTDTSNPFPAGYSLTAIKVNNPYMAGFDSYWPTYTRPAPFVLQDGNSVWLFAEKDKVEGNDAVPFYEIDKINMQTGVVEDSIPIQGDLSYWTCIDQDSYNYYIASTVYKKDDSGEKKPLKGILYAFSKKTKHIVWTQEFPEMALDFGIINSKIYTTSSGIIVENNNGLIYLDHNGRKIWEYSLEPHIYPSINAYNSKRNALVISPIDSKETGKYLHEVNIESGKAVKVPLKVEGDIISPEKMFLYGPFGKTDIAKSPVLTYVSEETIYPYTVLAYLSWDEKDGEYVLKEFKKLNPTPLENAQFQPLCAPWFYDIRPLGNGRYLYYDLPRIPYHLTSMYAILYNKDFSKKIWTIRVGKTNVKVNGETVAYIPINTFRIYDIPKYGKTLIYADKNKIVFADPDTAVPKAEFTLPAPLLTAKEGQILGEIVMPLGVSDGNLYISLIDKLMDGTKTVKTVTRIVKIAYEEAHLTVNSSVPGLLFTVSKDGKKYVVNEGKEVSLAPGTYTVSIKGNSTEYLKLPKPVTVTLNNGDSKTITLNYIRVYKLKLTIGEDTFTVNGTSETLDSPPVIIPKWGRTVVPIRAIVEALGGTISWDPTERRVDINLNGKTVSLWIGKNQAKVGWMFEPIDKDPDVKPIIINGRTMLPLRFVAESLGCEVEWDPVTRTITITYTS